MGRGTWTNTAVFLGLSACLTLLPLPRIDAMILGKPALPHVLYAGILSLVLGYGFVRMKPRLHKLILKRLFSYTGWLTNQKSLKTKVWAALMKAFRWGGKETTFMYQDLLPKMPVPSLEQTCKRYMESIQPLLDAQDFDYSKKVILDFQQKDGLVLQKYIEDRYKKTCNWMSDWWMTAAYMAGRTPLPVHSNYYMMFDVLPEVTRSQLARAANLASLNMKFFNNLQKGRVPVVKLQKVVPLCMDGLKRVFASARVPSTPVDYIQTYKDTKHFVVIREGTFYRVEAYAYDTKAGGETLLSVGEIYKQFKALFNDASTAPKQPPVAALTSQDRDTWAKQRERLLQNEVNKKAVETIESAAFIVALDDEDPGDTSHQAKVLLTGDGKTRWFDKSLTVAVFKEGRAGLNVEHSVADATHLAHLTEFFITRELYTKTGDIITSSTPSTRTLDAPKRLEWDLTDFTDDINIAQEKLLQMRNQIDVCIGVAAYSKGFPKKVRVSPDGMFQMTIQLAYWRLHKELSLTYESASTRCFELGRTETVRPHSEVSRRFVEAMDDANVSTNERVDLLRQAIKYQTQYRLEATAGFGCDRHLLGMLLASMELGMDRPAFYNDKAWQLKYKLSTSQTPTDLARYNLPMDIPSVNGGFGPLDVDGYGVAYVVYDDDKLNWNVTSWKHGNSNSSEEFFEALLQSQRDIQALFQ